MLQLFEQIVRRAEAGEAVAVCTLVATRGSCPQQAGAVMVVLADGRTLGTIGGGCVEAEVRTRALRALAERSEPRLLTFKLDHDLGWDDGLICGGTMDVAIEVVASADGALPFREARERLATGESSVITTRATNERGEAFTFSREVHPNPRLIIAGAGHVGQALAAISGPMGFDVTVIDDRPDYASAQRFPGATVRVAPIEEQLSAERIDGNTYVVIVTRGHRNDGRALAAVIGRAAKYVGLIGSRRKILAIFEDLRRGGVSGEALAAVHAPIGLDIGAVTPAEIAVSIAAELIAVRRGVEGDVKAMRLSAAQLKQVDFKSQI